MYIICIKSVTHDLMIQNEKLQIQGQLSFATCYEPQQP